ncbi:MAG: aldo/keto reductase [Microbacteriaceae bacterium]
MTDLELRRVGVSGLVVSAVGVGCNNFGKRGAATEHLEGTRSVIDAAIDAGVTLFDTADTYGREPGLSESLMGEALTGRREQVVIATKFGHSGRDVGLGGWGARGARAYVRRAVEASLTRLQTDWIDLYQIHTPDPGTPIAETLDVLDDLIREGKVRYIGHSNFTGWQIAEAEFTARERLLERFVSAQNHYSLLVRGAEREVLPAARRFGLGFLPFFPLRSGMLTGKYTREGGPEGSRIMTSPNGAEFMRDTPWDALEAYQAYCDAKGISMLEATFGWLLAQPGLSSVIAGATTPEQVRANVAAARWQPTPAEVAEIGAFFPLPADPAAG